MRTYSEVHQAQKAALLVGPKFVYPHWVCVFWGKPPNCEPKRGQAYFVAFPESKHTGVWHKIGDP